jgi:hypothetical protein
MVRDVDNSEFNDLIFVPTQAQLANIIFLPNTIGSGSNAVTYTPEQQRAAYNEYIENDNYLSTRRGQYAERNGARLPFTNVFDLKLQQDFNVKLGAKTYQLQLSYDVFNLGNMFKRSWGRQYFADFDQITILSFDSYASATDLTPRYKFTPSPMRRYNVSDGVFNSSRWTSQLGIRLNF